LIDWQIERRLEPRVISERVEVVKRGFSMKQQKLPDESGRTTIWLKNLTRYRFFLETQILLR